MEEKPELRNAIDIFIRNELYCSGLPTTQLFEYNSIKHLAFGTKVAGRTDEFIVYNANPADVIETINKLDIKKDYWLTVFSDEKPHHYDAEGYTIKSKEFLMMLHLDSWSFETGNKIIKRVKTEEEAGRINDFFGKSAFNLKKINDPNVHYYVGEENGHPASHGSYVLLDHIVYFDNVFTSETHRGKGIAKALCQKMLLDAKMEGANKSVLISSQMGHPLYLKLGYHDVSKMWVFERQS